MAMFDHPAAQSVAVPLFVSLAAAGLLHARLGDERGPRWTGAALGLGVLAASALLLSWTWPPGSAVEKLAWVLLAAWGGGLVLQLAAAPRRVAWLAASLLWLGVSWWLGARTPALLGGSMAAGTAVLYALSHASDRDGESAADGAALVVVAGLGLAALAFVAGSLLLMQLALLLAAATGGVGLGLWPRPRWRFGTAAWVTAGLAWAALAQATLVLTGAPASALLLLAAAFAVAALPRRATAWWRPLLVAALAAVVAAAAVAWAGLAHPVAAGGAGSGDDDPYYQPSRPSTP